MYCVFFTICDILLQMNIKLQILKNSFQISVVFFLNIIYFVYRTTKRKTTFYDGTSELHRGVSHIPMNEPFCPKLRHVISFIFKWIRDFAFGLQVPGLVCFLFFPIPVIFLSSLFSHLFFSVWSIIMLNICCTNLFPQCSQALGAPCKAKGIEKIYKSS